MQRAKTIGQLIDESLEFYGIKSREDARHLARRAQAHSKLSESQALAVAQEQVRGVRRKSWRAVQSSSTPTSLWPDYPWPLGRLPASADGGR